MKRLPTIFLLAALSQAPAPASDPASRSVVMPTTPQVPAPVVDQSGAIVQVSGISASRVLVPIRQRAGTAPVSTDIPLPTGFTVAGGNGGNSNCAGPDCGPGCGYAARGGALDRIRGWLFFHPTTGDALPKLRPQPYVGRVTGTFACTSGNGCGNGAYAGNAGCGIATGADGRVGPVAGGCRGGRGGCVPPADDAIPGYRFASMPHPTTGGMPTGPAMGYSSYRPVQPAAGSVKPVDLLTKPFTRP